MSHKTYIKGIKKKKGGVNFGKDIDYESLVVILTLS